MTHRFVAAVVALVVCLGLTGCGSKVSQSNYDKIKDGMSLTEVEGILGKGTEQATSTTGGAVQVPGMSAGGVTVPGQTVNVPTTSGKAMVWKDGSKVISVTFVNDKVMVKAQTGL